MKAVNAAPNFLEIADGRFVAQPTPINSLYISPVRGISASQPIVTILGKFDGHAYIKNVQNFITIGQGV
jgi:hypothetical protein